MARVPGILYIPYGYIQVLARVGRASELVHRDWVGVARVCMKFKVWMLFCFARAIAPHTCTPSQAFCSWYLDAFCTSYLHSFSSFLHLVSGFFCAAYLEGGLKYLEIQCFCPGQLFLGPCIRCIVMRWVRIVYVERRSDPGTHIVPRVCAPWTYENDVHSGVSLWFCGQKFDFVCELAGWLAGW